MTNAEPAHALAQSCSSEFWDALAPYHELIEDNYLDLRSARMLLNCLQDPVLVVGAGQGLIVAELRKRGFHCDGIDSSPEMIRYASLRRNISIIQADAKTLPFAPGKYKTILYATGVIDFISDEQTIRVILEEGRRIVKSSGRLFTAFYRVNASQEQFMEHIGLLANHRLRHRQSLEMYRLNSREMISWVAKQAGVSWLRAAAMLFSLMVRCRPRDLRTTLRMQRVFKDPRAAQALINAAPVQQPYRNAAEIRNLFQRIGIPIKQLQPSASCFIVEL